LIWGSREGIYFCGQDWTGRIALIRFDKFVFARTALKRAASRKRHCERSEAIHRGIVIPGRVEDANPESRDSGFDASHRPGMTESSARFAVSAHPTPQLVARNAQTTQHVFKPTGISMPLTTGQIGGHDSERLAFAFTMMNGGETVPCRISDAAMDELAGVKGTPGMARQAQFLAHRDAIERIASDLYDQAPRFRGYVVRIFTKHVHGG
jgi:hypothetical protein